MRQTIVLFSILCLAGCATPANHQTRSGKPEVTIRGQVGDGAAAAITNMMIDREYDIRKQTPTMLVFERPLTGIQSFLLSSQYDTEPVMRVTFNIIEMPEATRIIASFVGVTNPGSAFERLTPANKSQSTLKYQTWLNELKNQFEGVAAPAVDRSP